MMDQREQMLRMRDVLEHLSDCFDAWKSAPRHEADEHAVRRLAENLDRHAAELRRLCARPGQGNPRIRPSAAA